MAKDKKEYAIGAMEGLDALASLGSAFAQSGAIKAQAHYEQTMSEINQRFAARQAEETIRMGDVAASQHKKKVHQLVGSQRAALAAQGIDVGSGDALEIQKETMELGYMDALQIKNNAWRTAWGYKVEASNMASRSKFSGLAARNAANNTLLTGGLQFINKGMKAASYLEDSSEKEEKANLQTGQSYTDFKSIA